MPQTRPAPLSLLARTPWIWQAIGLTVALAMFSANATAGGLERLLPADSKGFLAVPDTQDLMRRWQGTDLGKVVADPAMRPFVEDLRGQLRSRLAELEDKLGMRIDDLRACRAGSCASPWYRSARKSRPRSLVIDVAGHRPQAAALLESITAGKARRPAAGCAASSRGRGDDAGLHPTSGPVGDLLTRRAASCW